MSTSTGRKLIVAILLVGLGAGLPACEDTADSGSPDTTVRRAIEPLTLCQNWQTRADGKVFCGNEVAFSPDVAEILDLKGKYDTAKEVVDLVDDSQVRQAIAGLKEIDAAGLSRTELASLRELSTFRRHPSVTGALFEDFMSVLQKVLSKF